MIDPARGAVTMRAAFDDFIAGLEHDFALPPQARPDVVRVRLQRALASADFYVQCARILLQQQHASPSHLSDLFADPQRRYILKAFCWPPGFGNDPHRHETWTIVGLMAGSLLVSRGADSAAECLASAPLRARSGEVGMLIPPQFHCLRNDGPETAVTFHLFSLDATGTAPGCEDGSASAPQFDDEDLLAIARMAVEKGKVDAADCIEAAFASVGPAVKLEFVKLMLKLDPERAAALGRSLSRLVGGEDGRRLLSLIERLEVAAREPPRRSSRVAHVPRRHG